MLTASKKKKIYVNQWRKYSTVKSRDNTVKFSNGYKSFS